MVTAACQYGRCKPQALSEVRAESSLGIPIAMTPSDCISSGYIPLRFNSHRSRETALGHRQLLSERTLADSGKWKFRACYSFMRASHGGYYIVERGLAEEIISRKVKGVSRLRGPYDDLRWCW